jgi:hypothetical protein
VAPDRQYAEMTSLGCAGVVMAVHWPKNRG